MKINITNTDENSQPVNLSDVAVIIAAGGSSSRFGSNSKIFSFLMNVPVIVKTLQHILPHNIPNENVIISINKMLERELSAILEAFNMKFPMVYGGETRSISVMNALRVLPEHIKTVAIHDAARPLATSELLLKCVEYSQKHNLGVIPGSMPTDTIKQCEPQSPDGFSKVVSTIQRNTLSAVQTPQVFPFKMLMNAYNSIISGDGRDDFENITDDASVFEAAGGRVMIFNNPNPNIKITFQNDLQTVENLLIAKSDETADSR